MTTQRTISTFDPQGSGADLIIEGGADGPILVWRADHAWRTLFVLLLAFVIAFALPGLLVWWATAQFPGAPKPLLIAALFSGAPPAALVLLRFMPGLSLAATDAQGTPRWWAFERAGWVRTRRVVEVLDAQGRMVATIDVGMGASLRRSARVLDPQSEPIATLLEPVAHAAARVATHAAPDVADLSIHLIGRIGTLRLLSTRVRDLMRRSERLRAAEQTRLVILTPTNAQLGRATMPTPSAPGELTVDDDGAIADWALVPALCVLATLNRADGA